MNAPVTRRALLGATAAVSACALPAVAEAGIPAALHADPDAGLFLLLDRYAEADTALRAAEDEAERLLGVARAAYPERPGALRHRSDDFPRTSYATGAAERADADGVRWYGMRGVEWLRHLKPPGVWTAACEARRAGIVEAFDAWTAEMAAVDGRVGWMAADEVRAAGGRAFYALDSAIRAHEVRTLPGLRAKAAWFAERLDSGVDETEDLAAFAREVAAFGETAS